MKTVLALDIGGSKLVAALVDQGGRVLGRVRHDWTGVPDRRDVMDAIDRCVCELDARSLRIGALVPGLADAKAGRWVYASFSGIRDWDFAREVSRRHGGAAVYIQNDVNACALAEKRFGCCKDVADYMWVTISNGIGGSLVLGGRLYEGAHGNAGEIGHLRVDEGESGFPCGCGQTGCLEAQAAGRGIARLYVQKTGAELTAIDIASRARQGDPAAVWAFAQAGRAIGGALAYAANLLNPAKIVLGGGVMQSDGLILPSIRESFGAGLFRAANPGLTVEKTALGYDAALLGAATIALEGVRD